MKVAVIGSGISGAVCSSILAEKGVSVTLFESGRGAGGRMSQRRETTDDGKELLFDHGAPFFTVANDEVMSLVKSWEAGGLVSEWEEKFGTFDKIELKFIHQEEEITGKKYVGVPGMNSICKALCLTPGIDANYGTTIGKLEWIGEKEDWLLVNLDGKPLGYFDAVVASDKNVISSRVKGLTGRSPPLDASLVPELATKLQEIPVYSCFALMMAFSEPLSSIPVKGILFNNSKVLKWAFCDSSKPERSNKSSSSECWVLHSTDEYAKGVIAHSGLEKPSKSVLEKVAEELFKEFQSMEFQVPQPFFMKAHRWGSAFPAIAIAKEEKCLHDSRKKLIICGDFCVSPNVEGAILSGMLAAKKLLQISSSL